MKYYIYSFIIFILVFSGCYDDKGNYSYDNINTITIGAFPSKNLTVGDTLSIQPELTFEQGVETENLIYEWQWCNTTRPGWDTRDFYWIVDTLSSGYLVLRISDPNSGVTYVQNQYYDVSSEFNADGWAILAEKDQKSYLTFIKENTDEDDSGVEIWANIVYEDVYKLKNGSELGANPIMLHEHFCSDRSTIGNLMIVQQGGQGMVDLDGFTFEKVISIDEAFAGHTLPANFNPVNTMSMFWVDLIENSDGKIFTRIKASDELFHSSSYLQSPMELDDQEVHAHIYLSKFKETRCAILHDFENNRLLGVLDQTDQYSAGNIGKPQVLPGIPSADMEVTPQDWVPLDDLGKNELIYLGYFEPDIYSGIGISQCTGFFMILQDESGKFWTQEFVINRDWLNSNLYLSNCKRNEIDLAPYLNENSVIYLLPYQEASEYVLISKDNNIYLYDKKSPKDPIKLFYTCSGNVTSIDGEVYNNRRAGIGLDNGQFVILNMKDAKNLQTDEEKLIWKTSDDVDLGRIVDVRFKVRSGNSWS